MLDSLSSVLRNSNQKGAAHIFVVLLLLAGLGVGVFLIQRPTNLKPKASEGEIPKIAGATLALSPQEAVFNQGCSYSFNVLLDTGDIRTDGTDVVLKYDPTIFAVASISNGSLYPDYPANSIEASDSAKISISGLSSPERPFLGKGVLATVNFTVNPGARLGKTGFSFDYDPNNKGKTTDSNIVESGTTLDVLNKVANGSYNISSGSCEEVPEPSSNPKLSDDSDYDGFLDKDEKIIGTDPLMACSDKKKTNAWPPDVDNNNKVDKSDYNKIQNAVKKQNTSKRYDLNVDGVVNTYDLAIVQSYNGKSCPKSPISVCPEPPVCKKNERLEHGDPSDPNQCPVYQCVKN